MLGEIFGVDGIVVLIIVVALLFGGAAIPKLARSLGSAKNQFAKGLEDGRNESDEAHGTVVSPAEVLIPVRVQSTTHR